MKILAALALLFIGWITGIISFIQLINWTGNRIVFWEYFLAQCGHNCQIAMAIALEEQNQKKEREKGNQK